MSTDREAVVWTRLGGSPTRMGRVYVTDKECRFTYDDDFSVLGSITTIEGAGYYPQATTNFLIGVTLKF